METRYVLLYMSSPVKVKNAAAAAAAAAATNKIIASFDIGIKNMAYCVLELNPGGEPVRILAWGIINMVPAAAEETEIPICSSAIPAKKATKKTHLMPECPCVARAAFTRAGALFCKKHIDKSIGVVSAKEFAAIGKKNITALREFCAERAILEAVDWTAKKAQMVEQIENLVRARFYIPVAAAAAPKNAGHIDLIAGAREMTRQLDGIFCGGAGAPLMGQLTHVFIENQISTIAVRMKTLQGMLTEYFILRGGGDLNVKYVSASRKLSGGAAGKEKEKKEKSAEKTTYGQRKKMGIELCAKILRESKFPEIQQKTPFFESYGAKRDDLADAFLQGIYGAAK